MVSAMVSAMVIITDVINNEVMGGAFAVWALLYPDMRSGKPRR